jgi:ECF transporter S component (folate family)
MSSSNLTYVLLIAVALVSIMTLVSVTTKTKFELKTMIIVSFMSLLSMVLAAYLSIMIPLFGFPSLKFGFSQLPIMISGALFGPWWGMVAGVLEDLLELASGTVVSPYIGFTLNKALIGIIPGLVFLFAKKYPKSLKPFIVGMVILLYGTSILLILSTKSVTASSVTYVLDVPVKIGLISISLIILPITYFIYRKLKNKDLQQTLFQQWLLSVILIELVINVILTPLWITQLYGIPFEIQVIVRSIKASFFVVLNTFLAYFIYRSLQRLKK